MSSSLYRKTKLLLPEHLWKRSCTQEEQQQQQRQEQEQKQQRSNDVLVSSSLLDRDNENENNDSRYVILPSESSEVGVDEYFQSISGMVSICHTLLSKDHVECNQSSMERILYVGQREVAHVDTTHQRLSCDIIVSDRATTCHILILRSTSVISPSNDDNNDNNNVDDNNINNNNSHPGNKVTLCSVTHIDSDIYNNCVRNMFNHHQEYHRKNVSSPEVTNMIHMDIHILGGFIEINHSSHDISNWLLHLLADIASEMSTNMLITLQTIAISSMNSKVCDKINNTNNNTNNKSMLVPLYEPIGRGLAIDCHTGNVFLAKCTHDAMGPEIYLRHSRLYGINVNTLLVISCNDDKYSLHEKQQQQQKIMIQPFIYYPYPRLHYYIQSSDEELLQSNSTSPHCEENDFCSFLRETAQFILNHPYDEIFRDRNVNNTYSNDDKEHNNPQSIRNSNKQLLRQQESEKNLIPLVFQRNNDDPLSNPNSWILLC